MVEYTAEERAQIAALTPYLPTRHSFRKYRGPGYTAVGRPFDSRSAIVYRTESNELILFNGAKIVKIPLRLLVPAEWLPAFSCWTSMLNRVCQPYADPKHRYAKNKSIDPRWLPGGRYTWSGTVEERREAFERYRADVERMKGAPLAFGDEISRGFLNQPHTLDEGGYWPTNIEVLSREEHSASLRLRNEARRAQAA